ncbi:MAG: DUF1957 domain-containing protein [Armatimonadetes bacterium CG_4_10_14_3_um_filter_66_18]|nr:DUF1957 domain-containing protein [Armatimonadota bacterium]PIY52304.1 MAG: DUF1957 domain-containing protein [Armatimonadetes bacterium CG_4_10_14_3_um_filter_66_18]
MKGSFVLVLHGHVPYMLGHGTWPHGSEMVMEAAAETYLPLLATFERLVEEGISPRVSMGLTPVLLEQLADPRFKEWFSGYLVDKRNGAVRNQEEFESHGRGHVAYLAKRWDEFYGWVQHRFHDHHFGDLVGAFRSLQEAGHIELITSAATHGYLPLLHEDASVQAQVKQGIACYERHFGRRPRGFWLPECAYRPRCQWAPDPRIVGEAQAPYPRKGIEEFLAENGIDYFVVDTHLLSRGEPFPVEFSREETLGKLWSRVSCLREPRPYDGERTPHAAYFVGDHVEDHPPAAAFFRDPDSTLQVWSSQLGYPGDAAYLDFHKKHYPGGHRYWRVTDDTGDLGAKEEYDPDRAAERAREHAGNFLWRVKATLEHQPWLNGRAPVVAAPFDAELFGHWWFEGPVWLEHVLRWMHQDPDLEVMTGTEYLAAHPPATALALPEGSWGAGGHHWVWLNEWTEWTWRRIYAAEASLRELVVAHPEPDETLTRLLQQAARELLLLQSSDWQFLITTWSARDYAEHRAAAHFSDFELTAALARRYADGEWLSESDWASFGSLCERDCLFPDVDLDWWRSLDRPALP